jgi:hypothetical protein
MGTEHMLGLYNLINTRLGSMPYKYIHRFVINQNIKVCSIANQTPSRTSGVVLPVPHFGSLISPHV